MRFCKRCHALSRTNPSGFCPDCVEFIDQDIRQSRRKLEELRKDLNENIGRLTQGKKETFVQIAVPIWKSMKKYDAWGYWVLPLLEESRDIVCFLDEGNEHFAKIDWDWHGIIPHVLVGAGGITWFLLVYLAATHFHLILK